MKLDDADFETKCPCGCGQKVQDILDNKPIISDFGFESLDDEHEDEDHDMDEDYDGEFISGATSNCPWDFEIPSELKTLLSNEQKIGSNDTDKSYRKKMWSKLWPNVTPDEIDPAQAAADYYLLFGIVNNSFVEFEPLVIPTQEKIEAAGLLLGKTAEEIGERKLVLEKQAQEDPRSRLTKLSKEAEITYHNLVNKLDTCFREYVHLACGGELRHHGAMGPALGGSYRRGAWAHWYYIYKDNGPDALLQMAELFEEFSGGSYGGPPWANAARILHQRETGTLGPDEFTNKQLFLDRVFTLEHNGGCFLNKLNWISFRDDLAYPYNCNFAEMKNYVLEAHAANPVNIDMLFGFASKEVQNMVTEYLQLAEQHDIEIVGKWKGTTVKKEKEQKVALKVVPTIDWGEPEKPKDVVNPLVAELEKTLANYKTKDNKTVSTLQDKLLYESVQWK